MWQAKWKEADVSRIDQQQRCGRRDGEGAELGGNGIDQRPLCLLTRASGHEPWVFLSNPNWETDTQVQEDTSAVEN